VIVAVDASTLFLMPTVKDLTPEHQEKLLKHYADHTEIMRGLQIDAANEAQKYLWVTNGGAPFEGTPVRPFLKITASAAIDPESELCEPPAGALSQGVRSQSWAGAFVRRNAVLRRRGQNVPETEGC
jgi:hypothetical protein